MLAHTRPKAIRGGTPSSDEFSFDSGSATGNEPTGQIQDSQNTRSSDDENVNWAEEEGSEIESSLPPEDEVTSISFGALARAQTSLLGEDSNKRKRPSSDAHPIHTSSRPSDTNDHNAEALERKAGKKDDRKLTRFSKHAPAELSSKKAVSRKRSVVPVPKREVRDPRFESALGPIDQQKIKSNYAFLEGYRDAELKALKAEIKETKSEEKERLKREVLRMESRKKAQEWKDAEQEVLRRHRKEERAKVEAGKTPFYLKKAEVRKEALVERYRVMKGREVDKLVERRRKKKASRDKRNMPGERRIDVR